MAIDMSQPSRRGLFAALAAWLAWLLGPRPAPAAPALPALRFVATEQPAQVIWSTYLGGTGFDVPPGASESAGGRPEGESTQIEFDPVARVVRTRTFAKDGRLVSDETRPW